MEHIDKSGGNDSVIQFLYNYFVGTPEPISGSSSGVSGDDISVSSIKKSEKEHESDPAVIQLAPPSVNLHDWSKLLHLGKSMSVGGVEASSLMQQIQKDYYDTCSKVLQKFEESDKEIAEQQKKKVTSSFYLALKDYINKAEAGTDEGNVALTSIMTIVAGLALVGGTIGVQAVAQSSISITAIQQTIAPVLAAAGDLRAELGLMGTLFGTISMYKAAAETAFRSKGGSEYDIEFGKNYAEEVIKTVNGPVFNELLKSMAASKNNNSNFPPLSKLTILMNAMALMTKLEVGHLTMEELAAMITGKITFKNNDPRTQLVALINQQLDLMDPQVKAAVLDSLLAYYNGNPPIEHMVDPVNAFRSLRNNASADASKVSQQTI